YLSTNVDSRGSPMAKISEAESAVMNVLWDEAPLDGEEVAARLKKQKWSRTTVRTLLARLVQKGAVRQKKAPGRKDQFSPRIDRAAYLHAESRNLFAQLAEREDLTADDIAELKALIERIEDDRR